MLCVCFCILASVIRHGYRMLRIILLSVVCVSVPHFSSTLSHKRKIFSEKKNTEHKTCVLLFSTTLSETFLILRRIQIHIVVNVVGVHATYPLLLSELSQTQVFLTDVRKIRKYLNSRKSIQWEQSSSMREI
jgi:hypothetical protein